jgi:hypothetical protein
MIEGVQNYPKIILRAMIMVLEEAMPGAYLRHLPKNVSEWLMISTLSMRSISVLISWIRGSQNSSISRTSPFSRQIT